MSRSITPWVDDFQQSTMTEASCVPSTTMSSLRSNRILSSQSSSSFGVFDVKSMGSLWSLVVWLAEMWAFSRSCTILVARMWEFQPEENDQIFLMCTAQSVSRSILGRRQRSVYDWRITWMSRYSMTIGSSLKFFVEIIFPLDQVFFPRPFNYRPTTVIRCVRRSAWTSESVGSLALWPWEETMVPVPQY